MPGREDFIYGSIRSKQKEMWYLGTLLNSVRPFPGWGWCRKEEKKAREKLDVVNESGAGSVTRADTHGASRQRDISKINEKLQATVGFVTHL